MFHDHLSSLTFSRVVQTLVVACPRLELLQVMHGRKYLSGSAICPAFPTLDMRATALPSSLVALWLEDTQLSATVLDGSEVRATYAMLAKMNSPLTAAVVCGVCSYPT